MNETDLEYLCRTIGSLAGMPVRIYQENKPVFYYSVIDLPKDPLSVYLEQVLAVTGHVGYFATPHFQYYGIVNSGNTKIIIGPSGQLPETEQDLRELAFRADVSADETENFVQGMKSIIPMPIESILQMLCTMNFVMNGEKLSLEDIAITDYEQVKTPEQTLISTEKTQDPTLHNTYDLEQALMHMIRKGDTAALSEWISNAPAVRGGVLAPDQLRQYKNTFIVCATLASRAAIRGGLEVDDAFTLSDAYIRKCELLSSPKMIINLQYHMILDFTDRVNRLHLTAAPTPLVLEVSNYIMHHMSEVITTESLADAMHLSRTYLCRKFRKESGMTLNEYILKEKTEEAKRLLRYTDKSLSAIGLYLGFSSQSHFSRVFRELVGMTPSEYRQKHSGA